ncbi:MAG: TIGR00282 family metallophosphoesterase [Deltaproteobacteria bacterium HGW-Deltaproteobacteria-10]|nr:MAG: TIGR00282 family metallophosphoesterase [Deltaproteobacteria bacterium HGW-Deltaproteobacteria-10]
MKILFIGDIVGKPGRRAVKELLPKLIGDCQIDLVIANCENAAAGFGVTRDIVEELYDSHIDILTSGNHIWDKKEIMEFIGDYETLLRPANYPAQVPGAGAVIIPTAAGEYVGVLNLAGRIFMQPIDCPFTKAKSEIAELRKKTKVIIVDIHAEATSEKKALGWYLDGEVSAVLGTHTHVQTADEEILPGGTAYLSDVGMTGPFDSVIGVKKEVIIEKFLTGVPNRFDTAKGDVRLQAVLLDIDSATGKANSMERISIKLKEPRE